MEMPEMPHSFTEREKASSFIETIMNPTGEKVPAFSFILERKKTLNFCFSRMMMEVRLQASWIM